LKGREEEAGEMKGGKSRSSFSIIHIFLGKMG